MKYFAIDFETASREQVSACSLGIVSGGDEGIQDKWYELIRHRLWILMMDVSGFIRYIRKM